MTSARSVLVHADGGSRGNPGPAGWGAVVFDPDGMTVLAERAAYLGRASNNVAEYSGLLAGLEAAHAVGPGLGVPGEGGIPGEGGESGEGDDVADPAAVLPGPLPTGATRVIVVRHGETTWGADGRFAGREDVPLTNRGWHQASSVAEKITSLRPGIVLTSGLQRCRLTARSIGVAAGAPVLVHEALLDGALGEWTGLRPAEIESGWPQEFSVWRLAPDAAPPGGESFNEIRNRVAPLLDEVVRRYRGHTVVLVTHAAVTKMILTTALDIPSDAAYRFRIDTASLSGLTIDDGGAVMVWAVNETGHLTG